MVDLLVVEVHQVVVAVVAVEHVQMAVVGIVVDVNLLVMEVQVAVMGIVVDVDLLVVEVQVALVEYQC